MDINQIINQYTKGEITPEEANAALKEAGVGFHFEPGQNTLTAEEIAATVGGPGPEDADGWGLLDTGTGSLDKVHVEHGVLTGGAINQVREDGSTTMTAYVHIGGYTYEVYGDTLGYEAPEEVPAWVPDEMPLWAVPWPEELTKYIPDVDMLHRPEYKNRIVRKGQLRYRYDNNGDAVYYPVDRAQYDRDHGRG